MKFILVAAFCIIVVTQARTFQNKEESGVRVGDPVIHKRKNVLQLQDKQTRDIMDLINRIFPEKRKQKGLTDEDIQEILDKHNALRSKVKPTSKDMTKLHWCPEIAEKAQSWASTCPNGHDTNEARKIKGWGIDIGQNWAKGYKNWNDVIQAWYDEVKLFHFGGDYEKKYNWYDVGHYTQVVRDKTQCIGCGIGVNCPGGDEYVCDYAYGNPYIDKFGFPYEYGTPCSSCPGHCKEDLCDCGDIVCKNGGDLDMKSCKCLCPDLYNDGKDCSKITCKEDAPECNQDWGFQPKHCSMWTNVPGTCPHMCQLC